jgi:hypothetical protein
MVLCPCLNHFGFTPLLLQALQLLRLDYGDISESIATKEKETAYPQLEEDDSQV